MKLSPLQLAIGKELSGPLAWVGSNIRHQPTVICPGAEGFFGLTFSQATRHALINHGVIKHGLLSAEQREEFRKRRGPNIRGSVPTHGWIVNHERLQELLQEGSKGFTLIELIIVLVILAILGLLLSSLMGGCSLGPAKTGVYQCVKTYTYTSGESTSKRVDLRPEHGEQVETVVCDDSHWYGINNSATLYAQFEAGRWYQVTTEGKRKEGWYAKFPHVTAVHEIADPHLTPEAPTK